MAEASWNLTRALFPSPLNHWDSPLMVSALLWAGVVGGLCFAAGCGRRAAAVLLWYLWTCLFHRNNLISNPALPYIGLALLLTVLVPTGEGASFSLRKGFVRRAAAGWRMPAAVPGVMGWLLALGYSFSGWTKLTSPSWTDGSALRRLLDNPLARPGPLRDLLLALPEGLLQAATWGVLALELFYLPLWFAGKIRPLAWLAMVGAHLGILGVCDFADLTLGMLLAHALVLDGRWGLLLWENRSRSPKPRGSYQWKTR